MLRPLLVSPDVMRRAIHCHDFLKKELIAHCQTFLIAHILSGSEVLDPKVDHPLAASSREDASLRANCAALDELGVDSLLSYHESARLLKATSL